jgi:hypothetical protein
MEEFRKDLEEKLLVVAKKWGKQHMSEDVRFHQECCELICWATKTESNRAIAGKKRVSLLVDEELRRGLRRLVSEPMAQKEKTK